MNDSTTTDYRDLPAHELWQRFKAGDELAFGQLAQQHYRSLYNYGLRLTTDSELVWDTIQDLFLELWMHRETVGQAVFVKAYLLKSLRYKLLKVRDQHLSCQLDESTSDEILSTASIEEIIIDVESNTAQEQLLNRLIESLTKRQREILYLRFYQNLDNAAIAQILGMERQSVANLLHRTLKELRHLWSPHLYTFLLILSQLEF
ncbi:sigma-70 family RNA polymerase sigma factor [Spirosoma daeguense]